MGVVALPGDRVDADAISHVQAGLIGDETAEEVSLPKFTRGQVIGTDLEARLRAAGIKALVICGATTNHCVETTTRMAGNLGFDARLVRDATWTFDRIGPDGDAHSAEDIHAMTLANLNGEFARIVSAKEVVAALREISVGVAPVDPTR